MSDNPASGLAEHQPEAVTWQQALKRAVRDPAQLCRLLELPEELAAEQAARDFPVMVPLEYLRRITPRDPADPLLRQVLPVASETVTTAGFEPDPVGDGSAQLLPGLLQKYRTRVLMVTTGACAVHCRYCFRRHYPYGEVPRGLAAWEPALEQIHRDETIQEVILSGGDPLVIVDSLLSQLAGRLEQIPHLTRLRIHTRLPVVIPQRVNGELLDWLCGGRLAPLVVVHINHPREIDEAVAVALLRLVEAGVPVLNQAVLLAGVNDSPAVLTELCRKLVDLRVMPYYLHQLDRVAGGAHFEVPTDEGLRLMAALRDELPGYAVPRYVQEIAGERAKTPLVERGVS